MKPTNCFGFVTDVGWVQTIVIIALKQMANYAKSLYPMLPPTQLNEQLSKKEREKEKKSK